jgi:hypothetical protein
MLLTLLMLGGVAVLAGAALDISSASDDEIDEEFERGGIKEPENDTFLLDRATEPTVVESSNYIFPTGPFDTEIESYDVDEVSNTASESDELLFSQSNFGDTSDPTLEECTDNLQDTRPSTSLIFGQDLLDNAASPLSDWTSGSGVVKIDLEESNIVSAKVEFGEGRLHILQADYFERIGSESEGSKSIIHTGANIYFVPSDEEFPENYVWSESGASLYNTKDFESDPQDFGKIKFVSRIDTGVMYGDVYDQEAIDFQQKNYEDLQIRFRSNVEFNFFF